MSIDVVLLRIINICLSESEISMDNLVIYQYGYNYTSGSFIKLSVTINLRSEAFPLLE